MATILTRRSLLSTAAGFAAGTALGADARPRAGCQANAWNLDPQKFDLLLTALREIKELQFEGFETNIRFFEPQLGRVKEARAAVESAGLVFAGAHTNVPDYEKDGFEKAADAVTKVAADARAFGARALVVSHRGLSPKGEFTREALDAKARMLNLAGKRSADAGIVLAYHNHQPEFQNGAAEAKGLVERTDPKLVSLMFDIGHAWLAYPDVIPFFEAHAARVYGLHVRDFHNRVSVPLGDGEFPLARLAEAIRRQGWHGWLIDEEERPDMPDKPGKRVTGPSRKTMRAVFGV